MVVYGRRNSGGFPDGTYVSFTQLSREGIVCTAPLQDLQNPITNPTIMLGIGAAVAGTVSFLILRKRKR
jgi:LPXTG-motif cell wall-anchored protein